MTSPVPTTDPLFPAHWLTVADGVCAAFYAEFPDHDARYGGRGRAYCAHDNAYLIAWVVDALDTAGAESFRTNVLWLRGLLDARGFPMAAFARNLVLVGDAVSVLRPGDTQRIRDLIGGVGTARPT